MLDHLIHRRTPAAARGRDPHGQAGRPACDPSDPCRASAALARRIGARRLRGVTRALAAARRSSFSHPRLQLLDPPIHPQQHLDHNLTPRVVDRLRLSALHATEIRRGRIMSPNQLNAYQKPLISRDFTEGRGRVCEGTRTTDTTRPALTLTEDRATGCAYRCQCPPSCSGRSRSMTQRHAPRSSPTKPSPRCASLAELTPASAGRRRRDRSPLQPPSNPTTPKGAGSRPHPAEAGSSTSASTDPSRPPSTAPGNSPTSTRSSDPAPSSRTRRLVDHRPAPNNHLPGSHIDRLWQRGSRRSTGVWNASHSLTPPIDSSRRNGL